MSARKGKKGKEMSVKEKQLMLEELFPEIDGDVVKLVLDNFEGDVDEAHSHLRLLDLEIWATKNYLPSSTATSSAWAGSLYHNRHVLSVDDQPTNIKHDNGPSLDTATDKHVSSSEGGSDSSLSMSGGGDGGGVHTTGTSSGSSSLDFEVNNTNQFHPTLADSTALKVNLDKDLAVQLIMTFGLMQVPIDINDAANLAVNLDMHLAYKLYQAWKSTQEGLVMPTSAESAITEDEQLARCLQDCEHESYAEHSLKQKGMQEIMDETYALSLAETDSNGRGLNLPSSLQYQSSGGQESKWVDALLRSHSLSPESGYPSSTMGPKNVYAKGYVHVVPPEPSAVQKSEASLARPSSAKVITVTPVTTGQRQSPSRTNHQTDSVDYFGERQDALNLQRKAIEYGARAGQAYADKKAGGGVAAYYLQKSHEHKSMAKEAHLAASLNILNSRNLNAGDGEIDLHGLRMEEVDPALDDFFARKHTVKEIKIISGRGVHSRNGTSEVRRRVHVYLNKHGFQFNEGPPEGVFYVQKWQKSKLKPP